MMDQGISGGVCMQAHVTNHQIELVVDKYLSDHPENLHLLAATLIQRGLLKARPCPVKMK
jgi:hypothetical protein